MPVQWICEAEYFLIEKVCGTSTLWDTRHKDYSKKLLRKHLYKMTIEELQAAFPDMEGLDADAVGNHINIMKAYFCQELAKIRQIKSGSGGDYTPKWKLFDSLSFAADSVTPKDSTSNLSKPKEQVQQPPHEQLLTVHTMSEDTLSEPLEPMDDIFLDSPSSSLQSVQSHTTSPSQSAGSQLSVSFPSQSVRSEPVHEDIPYACGIVVQTCFRRYPKEHHVELAMHLTCFLREMEEDLKNINKE